MPEFSAPRASAEPKHHDLGVDAGVPDSYRIGSGVIVAAPG